MRVLSILGDPHPKGRSWSTNPTREGSRTLISMEVKRTTLPRMSKFYARWATRSIIVPAGFFRGALSGVPADRGHGPAGRWATGLEWSSGPLSNCPPSRYSRPLPRLRSPDRLEETRGSWHDKVKSLAENRSLTGPCPAAWGPASLARFRDEIKTTASTQAIRPGCGSGGRLLVGRVLVANHVPRRNPANHRKRPSFGNWCLSSAA